MKKVNISVIIPFFNVEAYIKETLDSVLQQNLDGIEVILVNDGSTDKSLDIVKSTIGSNEHFVIYEQENQGQSVARNTGLKIARGEYILFLDSDDLLSENYCENLYNIAKTNDLDLLCTDTMFLKDGDLISQNFISEYIHNASNVKTFDEEILFVIKSSVIWGKLYKNSFLRKNNIVFKNFNRFEDNYFLFNYCFNNPKIGYCLDSKIYYRIRENSVMTSIDPAQKHYREMLTVIESIEALLNDSQLQESALKKFNYCLTDIILEALFGWGKKYKDYDFMELLLSKLRCVDVIFNPYIRMKKKRKILKLFIKVHIVQYFKRLFRICK